MTAASPTQLTCRTVDVVDFWCHFLTEPARWWTVDPSLRLLNTLVRLGFANEACRTFYFDFFRNKFTVSFLLFVAADNVKVLEESKHQ